MKIKTLAALCKKAGVFYLYDRITDDGEVAEQWLGTGGAIFPLHGLPYMQENNLFTLFDITDKQQEKIYFRHEQLPTKAINFEDMDPNENILDREKLTIGHAGKVLDRCKRGAGWCLSTRHSCNPLRILRIHWSFTSGKPRRAAPTLPQKAGLCLWA